jgi:hypothetical protein
MPRRKRDDAQVAPPDATPAPVPAADDEWRAQLKEAVAEALAEQRGLIQSIVEDALQEMAFADAMREVESHERRFGRRVGFRTIEGEA